MSRVIARLLCLPRENAAAETRLLVTSDPHGERWLRTFDGRRLDTHQYQAGHGILSERVGILEFRFAVDVSDGGLRFRQLAAAITWGRVRLPLPVAWSPRVAAREDADGPHRIRVHVCVALPVVGPVLTYDGAMDFEEALA